MLFRQVSLLLGLAVVLSADVSAIRVLERSLVLDGAKFGKAGAYERIVARAHFEVDPQAAANARVTDLELAPRNKKGLVEFSADVFILKPTQLEKGNGTVFFEVANRGGKGLLRSFNGAATSRDPRTSEDFGDGFLLNRGFTLVWVGWQFDLLEQEHALRLEAPVAKGTLGWTRSHFSPSERAKEFSVAGAGHGAYPATNPSDPEAKLIERQYADGPGKEIPRERWRFSDPETVLLLDGEFAAGRTYDVVYRSKDPGIAGLGAAAIRDFISFLKFGSETELGELDDFRGELDHAIAYGSSQSGRFLRSFLYEGFNADDSGRKVFDGIWPHIAGAARGSFLHRFAQPTRQDPFYTVEIFPFRDLDDEDPLTGETGGILARAEKDGVVPKLFYTLTSSEYWNRSASLLHTTLDGKRDAPLADDTRIYYFAGTQHGSGSVPPRKSPTLKYALNANSYSPLMRALAVAFEEWVSEGKEPPPSKYPAAGELATLDDLNFPKIPALLTPGHQRVAARFDFGPQYREHGVIDFQPPRTIGPAYPAKLPQLDADGNELGGIRLPLVSAPLASLGGWNRYRPSVSRADHSPGNSGATLPFAWSAKERSRLGDPRRSVEERYKSRSAYQRQVQSAAESLAADGYLLRQDVQRAVDHSLSLWDHFAATAGNGHSSE